MAGKPRGLCHYCKERSAKTWDHIVAKSHLPKFGIPMPLHQKNKVPCCIPCNLFKKNFRSDCNCAVCMTAWEIMAPFLLPKRKRDIPVIQMSDLIVMNTCPLCRRMDGAHQPDCLEQMSQAFDEEETG